MRDRFTSATAIHWHPVEELVELLSVTERLLGRGDGKLAEKIGAAGARANMKGMLARMAIYLARPEFVAKRIAAAWRQFNDEGEMQVLSVDPSHLMLEVRGVASPDALFCATLTGWSNPGGGPRHRHRPRHLDPHQNAFGPR